MAENKIESYLIDLRLTYREIGDGMWMVEDEGRGLEGVVVMRADPLAIIRVSVMAVPKEGRLELFTKLLELNAKDLLHGAYALEGDEVVLVDTLELETMDLGDFQAALDAIGLALVQHYPILSEFRTQ
jgi:hypothetical protein